MNNWKDQFDLHFPSAAMTDMQRAYIQNIKDYIQTLLDQQRQEILGKVETVLLDRMLDNHPNSQEFTEQLKQLL